VSTTSTRSRPVSRPEESPQAPSQPAKPSLPSPPSAPADPPARQQKPTDVISGIFSTLLVFVPLSGAVVSPSYLKVTADRKLIKHAPSIDVDGELTSEDEPAVFEHYGLTYQLGASGERRLGRR
jgi:hypothetical protein